MSSPPSKHDPLAPVRAALAAAAAGVAFVSESEAPFTPVAVPPDGDAPDAAANDAPPTAAEVRRRFGVDAALPVGEQTLDAFFRYGIEAVDPADAGAQAAVPAVRALREAVRRAAPDARAFRVGDGPTVRYLIVGHAAEVPGALVGLETVGYES